MRENCTDSDCYCGTCHADKVIYNVWKDPTSESDEYGQTPNCEICDKVWTECNPVSGPHDAQYVQEYFESYWITTAVALNYFGPIPKHHPFATPANIHDFHLAYTMECLQGMKESIEGWLEELEQELPLMDENE